MADAEDAVPIVQSAERVPWLVVLLASGGTDLLPGQRLLLRGVPADDQVVEVALSTRFEDAGLTDLIPRELTVEVYLEAPDADTAVAQAGAVASGLVALLSFAVNAFVPPAEPFLAYEVAPGLTRRRFWQRHVIFQQGAPRPSRMLKDELLFPLLHAFFGSPHAGRLGRAASQYHVALSHWTTAGRPLALAHLYMALEALTPVAEERTRQQLNLATKEDHARHRGVDVTERNWNSVLEGWVRRDVLCQGDSVTYNAARKASDGFEHGFMDLRKYRAAAEQHARPLMNYVRAAVLDLLDVGEPVRTELNDKRPIDVSPIWHAVTGELHGNVEDPTRMAEAGQSFPYADWHITLDDNWRLPDGRLRMAPRMHLTAHIAEDVQITWTGHGLGVGLSDADLFDYEPSAEEPVIIRRGEQGPPAESTL